jgi:FKBP-type peptidyl-prolyl cis-trans isomerase 2
MASRYALTAVLAAGFLAGSGCRRAEPLAAGEGRVVTFHYTLKAAESFVDSTETKGPQTIVVGEKDGLIPGLRKGLIGMKPGEERAFSIPPEEGFSEGGWSNRVLQARVKILAVREKGR